MLQDKQAEIEDLEMKRLEADNGRLEAERRYIINLKTHLNQQQLITFNFIVIVTFFRFEKETAAVNSDLKVKELQNALERAEVTCDELKKVC